MGRYILGALALLCCAGVCTASLYTASSPVTSLDSDNFKAKMKNNQMALVKFYAPWCGHCTALQPDFEKVAKAMKGAMLVAAIDADAHKDLGQEFGIKGFPSIKFLYMEGDKVKSVDYQGQRTAKDIIPWAFEKAKNLALKRIGEKASSGGAKAGSPPKGAAPPKGGAGEDDSFYKGTDVVTLSDSNFSEEVTGSNDLWLVEFYAPWCGHCKNLKPNWIEAATELKGKVKLGAVDCTIHKTVCSEYGVQGYPTIKFFGQSKSSPEDYQGPREAQGIVTWAKEKWSRVAPPPEVLELTDNNAWEKTCVGEKGKGGAALCILAFLPDILDAKAVGRNRHIKLLKKVAEKFKDQPYAYLWAQGGAQAGLEANLGVGGFGYPALVALNPKKKFFTLARGAFEEKHVIDFLEGLKLNRYPVQSVQGDLAAITSNAPWDGKDAAVQLEDEFSLDDLE